MPSRGAITTGTWNGDITGGGTSTSTAMPSRRGSLSHHEITLFGVGALLYGGLELVEGVGLFLRRRWAEWLTVIATSLLIPFEVYELVKGPSWLKGAGLAVNILIVVYLIRIVREKGRTRSATIRT